MASEPGHGYYAGMDHHHTATFVAIGAALFASMTGAAIAISVAIWSARRAKASSHA
jgi:hypothetical protein